MWRFRKSTGEASSSVRGGSVVRQLQTAHRKQSPPESYKPQDFERFQKVSGISSRGSPL